MYHMKGAHAREIASSLRLRVSMGRYEMERVKGIEPSYSAWEADVITIYFNYLDIFLLVFCSKVALGAGYGSRTRLTSLGS